MNKEEIIGICEFLRIHHFKNAYKLLDYIIDLQKENEQLTISLSAQEELTMNEYTKKDKYKEVLDKIKEYAEKYKIIGVIAPEENEYMKHILKLLEEIE